MRWIRQSPIYVGWDKSKVCRRTVPLTVGIILGILRKGNLVSGEDTDALTDVSVGRQLAKYSGAWVSLQTLSIKPGKEKQSSSFDQTGIFDDWNGLRIDR
jgi:hypothetical protein